MNEIMTTIANEPLYLGGIGLVSMIIGFVFANLFKKDSKVDAEQVIEEYVDEVVEGAVAEKAKPSKPVSSSMPSTNVAPRVLIAEDNLVNAKILIKLLKKFGIEDYKHVEDGLLAVEARKEDSYFDIVLMDINMPNMTGDEATQEIIKWENSNNESHIPIIAVTANALIGDREKYLDEGMDDYTTKPLKIDEIGAIIKKYTGYDGSF